MVRKLFIAVVLSGLIATACSNDDDSNPRSETSDLTLNLQGLEELGSNFVYEGWLIVDGSPISTGVFSSVSFPQTFSVGADVLNEASTFVLSIEPAVDTDPLPSTTKILAGNFDGSTAAVNSEIVGDFTSSSGTYILATPTDDDDTNEDSGVWFLDNSTGTPMAGLNLPLLPDGWKYEGWVVFDGTPLSTGTFVDVAQADDNALTSMFKGDMGNGPNYPGEDYLQNSPSGLTFPTTLKGKTVVISVEPSPDNSELPFALKPLAGMIPIEALTHSPLAMGEGPLMMLSGTVTKN